MAYTTFMQLWEARQLLKEDPYLVPTRKDLEDLSSLSQSSIDDGFNFIGSIPQQDLDVYENKETGAILAGVTEGERFYISLRITCEERGLFVKSMQLTPSRKHVKMLNTNKQFARQAIARDVYIFVAKRFDLISDRVQYVGAKVLWQSLAKNSPINVYVFNESDRDYVRDEDGVIVKYNGQNIDEQYIWGQDPDHQDRLLVATVRELV